MGWFIELCFLCVFVFCMFDFKKMIFLIVILFLYFIMSIHFSECPFSDHQYYSELKSTVIVNIFLISESE
jgi:hypothetical protein